MSRWWLALLLVAAGGRCRAAEGAPVVWRLDNLRAIGGLKPELWGAPQVTAEPAVRFNGVADGVVLPVDPVAGWREFTIEALIRPDAAGEPEPRFFHIEDEQGHRATLEIRLTADGRWALDTFLLDGDRHLALLDRTRLHPAGRWTWVALRYDGRTMTSFVDGVAELAGAVTVTPFGAGRTALGVRLNRVDWYKGDIKEVRFHDRALAAAELQRNP
ncbi:MAG TPA: LamG domain-containing protein [Opitutaceae bacterium]|nr:LamG domain-containing protein [Opitutaceae bacterium]